MCASSQTIADSLGRALCSSPHLPAPEPEGNSSLEMQPKGWIHNPWSANQQLLCKEVDRSQFSRETEPIQGERFIKGRGILEFRDWQVCKLHGELAGRKPRLRVGIVVLNPNSTGQALQTGN